MRFASLVVAGFLFPVVPVAAQDRNTTSAGTSQQDSQEQQPPYVPGVRPGGVNIGDVVKIGGYGSVRYETNSLTAPKPAGFDFRRFVLTTDATPSDRLRAYVEIEFERLGEIEVERQVQRTADGIRFKEELEGGSNGELSIEQMWGQFKFGEPFSIRVGAILPPVGRFNIAHDDDRWDVPRRSLVDRGAPVLPVHSAWTELGAGVVGSAPVGATGRLDYQAYVVNGASLDFAVEKGLEAAPGEPGTLALASEFSLHRGPVNGEGGTRAGTWRLAYSPALSSEIAVSGYHGRYTPDFLAPVEERINAVGLDGLFRRGGFALEGEFIHSDFGNTDRLASAFLQAITGPRGIAPAPGAEGTATEFTLKDFTPSRHGFWVEARYRFWPAAWRDSVLGKGFENPQLTPLVRYERVSLRDAIDEIAITGREIETGEKQTLEQERTTIGLSYRPIPTVVFSVVVEHNRRLNGQELVFPRGTAAGSYTALLAGMAFGF
jgi:hypothetical protein